MDDLFSMHMTEAELRQMTPLAIAHCGDAVFELLVRSWLCAHGGVRSDELHRRTVAYVSAGAQSQRTEKLLPLLDEWELAWYKRGRNAHLHGIPKNATPAEYGRATGLECLFGALYLTGRRERANELFLLTTEANDGT